VRGRQRLSWQAVLRPVVSAIGLALLFYLLTRQDWDRIRGLVAGIGWPRLLLSLMLILISRLAVAGRWHILLRGVGVPVRLRETLEITFAGLFAANFLPTTVGGDVVRLAGAFQLRADRAVTTASLIVDRLVGMAGMALALPVGLLHLGGVLTSAPVARFREVGDAVSVAAIPWLAWPVAKIRSAARRVWSALGLWLRRPAWLGLSLVSTLVHMTFLFGTIQVLLAGMGEGRGFIQVAGAWSLVYFITLFPFSVNGLGVQELALTAVFSGALGVSGGATLVLAVTIRVVMMLASLPGALFLGRMLPEARQVRVTEDVR